VDNRPPHDGNILENYQVDTVIVYHGVMIRGDRESSFENRLYNVNNMACAQLDEWRIAPSCLWWEMLMGPCGVFALPTGSVVAGDTSRSICSSTIGGGGVEIEGNRKPDFEIRAQGVNAD
jgi:hypothetical protein